MLGLLGNSTVVVGRHGSPRTPPFRFARRQRLAAAAAVSGRKNHNHRSRHSRPDVGSVKSERQRVTARSQNSTGVPVRFLFFVLFPTRLLPSVLKWPRLFRYRSLHADITECDYGGVSRPAVPLAFHGRAAKRFDSENNVHDCRFSYRRSPDSGTRITLNF